MDLTILQSLNSVNLYVSLSLIIFGICGNLLTLAILIYSCNKMPRIIGTKYLISFTVTNTVCLLLHFYTNTYNRLIFRLKLEERNFHGIDSCLICCKVLFYLKYCAQSLSTMLTVCYCLELVLAVYWPRRQLESLAYKKLMVFRASIAISFLMPTYFLIYYGLVPNDEESIEVHKAHFTAHSLTPSFGQYSCSIDKNNFWIIIKFNFMIFILTLFCYCIVSASIIAILIKLRKKTRFTYKFKVISADESIRSDENSFIQETEEFRVVRKQMNLSSLDNKLQDTKKLIAISLNFVLLYTPYFVILFYAFLFAINNNDLNLFNDLELKLKIQWYLVITENFQLINFSITGLLFSFGKIFRLHAFKFLKQVLCFKP